MDESKPENPISVTGPTAPAEADPPPDPPAPAEVPAEPPVIAEPPRPVKPPAAQATPEELAAFDADTHKMISRKVDSIQEAKKAWEDLKKETKDSSDRYVQLQAELLTLIAERRASRGKPVQRTLFDFAPPAAPPIEAGAGVVSTSAEADPLEHLWRQVPLSHLADPDIGLGARPKDIDILNAGEFKNGNTARPLMTMGDLADFTAGVGYSPGYVGQVTDLRGIGPGGAIRIADAATAFWAWWNQRGGKEAFARSKGLIDDVKPEAETVAAAGGEATGDAGGDGQGGEPAGPAAGADGQPAERSTDDEVNDPVWVPVPGGDAYAEDPAILAEQGIDQDDAEVATVPEGGPDIYPLGGATPPEVP